MGKQSRRRPGKGGKKVPREYRIDLRILLPPFELPLPIGSPATPTDFTSARAMADFVLENFRCFKRNKLNKYRYALWRTYFSIILLDKETWCEQGRAVLEKIAWKKSEPTHFRVDALFLLAHFHMSGVHFNLEKGILYCETIIHLCNNASEDEKRLPVLFYLTNPSRAVESTVGDMLLRLKPKVEQILHQEVERKVPVISLVSGDASHVPRTAGGHCDNCNKSREELCIETLPCCQVCELAFYCSKACQTQDWKQHKKYCRAEGDYRENDQAVDSRNGQQVVLVRKVKRQTESKKNDDHDNWEVTNVLKADNRVISEFHLRRLRPALWQEVMSRTERKQRMMVMRTKLAQLNNEIAILERQNAEHTRKLEHLKTQEKEANKHVEQAQQKLDQLEKELEDMALLETGRKLTTVHEELLTRFARVPPTTPSLSDSD